MGPAPRKRPRSGSEHSSGSSGSVVSDIAHKVGSTIKKASKKAVASLTPKKSSRPGAQSDTPHSRRTRSSTKSVTPRSFNSSLSSQGSVGSSDQSTIPLSHSTSIPINHPIGSFQFDLGGSGSDAGSGRSSSPSNKDADSDTSSGEVEVVSQEDQDKKDLGTLLLIPCALASAKRAWTSTIYAFFDGEVGIEYRNGKTHHVFTCAARGCAHKIFRNQSTQDRNSTTNLRKHALKCWGEENVKAAAEVASLDHVRRLLKKNAGTKNQKLTDIFRQHAATGGESFLHVPLEKHEVRAEHVRWVSESLRPFAIAKDRGYRQLMKSGRPLAFIPSPSTIARDVKRLFEKTRERIKRRFKKLAACISTATDAWTSPNHKAYVAVSGHFEEDGVKVDCLLDFVEVPVAHTGENLAEVLSNVIHDFGIENKHLSITADNASSNDTMMTHLETLLPSFSADLDRMRCFAHVINLVAKSLLKMFDPPKKDDGTSDKNRDDDADDDEPDGLLDLDELLEELHDLERTAPEQDDTDDIFDEVAQMLDNDRTFFLESTKEIRSALSKIRNIAKKTINSTTKLLPRWQQTVKDHRMKPKMLPRDVRTRWNSTFDMINTALDYKKAIRDFTFDDSNGLSNYNLSSLEWTILEDLRDVLQSFKDATLFFSRNSATLATVIPAMDKIDSMLATAVVKKSAGESKSFSTPIKLALLSAKKTLNRYYSKSDYSRIYRIALNLHPRYKLDYMERNDWDEEDINEARQQLEEVFQE
ncbi:ribonuclease H-like domain-containing protein [Favolaschia claudopus]|uniref:Ribonuclease H-like domain-containing protein n=1 Tax=Favolaschia claudopus TaxID=2862362 RepID=A0AAV9ZBL2_9AGAR